MGIDFHFQVLKFTFKKSALFFLKKSDFVSNSLKGNCLGVVKIQQLLRLHLTFNLILTKIR